MITHTHIISRGIWSLMSRGGSLPSAKAEKVSISDTIKDDQVEQDVISAKQRKRWGVNRQLKQTSCKCEHTQRRQSSNGIRKEPRVKKKKKE